MGRILVRGLTVAVVVEMLCAGVAVGQSTDGGIRGTVVNKLDGQPLHGASVVARLRGQNTDYTGFVDKHGSYRITALPPGRYDIRVFLGDDKPLSIWENVLVSTNTTLSMPFSVLPGELIICSGAPPLVNVRDPGIRTVISADQAEKVPYNGRDALGVAGAAAATSSGDNGIAIAGTTELASRTTTDGADTTSVGYGLPGSQVVRDFVHETEVITGGFRAEYGRSTGGIINVVTKSGSDRVRGSVFTRVSPGFLIADRKRAPTQASSIDAQVNTGYDTDFGFEVGGPVVKGHLWYFVGVAPRFTRTDITKITKRQTDCREVVGQNQLSRCRSEFADGTPDVDPDTGFRIYEDLDRTELASTTASYQYIAKLNWAVTPQHQGQISVIGTPANGRNVGITGDPAATSRDSASLTSDMAFKWSSKFNSNKTELDMIVGWHHASNRSDSIDDGANDTARETLYFGNLGTWSRLGFESMATSLGCADGDANDPYPLIDNCPDYGQGYAVGGPGSLVDVEENRVSAKAAVTQRFQMAGHHEIKAGLDIEDNRYTSLRYLSGGVIFNNRLDNRQIRATRWVRLAPDDDAEGYMNTCVQGGTGGQAYDCEWLGRDTVSSHTVNWSGYLRDVWQPVPNLAVNIGARYEEQRLRYEPGLQGTVDPLSGAFRGKNALEMTGMWAPRVGVLWDWTKAGKSKLFANYARYYESIPLDINNRLFGGETSYEQIFSVDQCGDTIDGFGTASGLGCPTDRTIGQPAGGGNLNASGILVAPGVQGQYQDEILVGAEYQVFKDLKIGLSYQRRWIGRVLEDVSVDNAGTYVLANPGDWSRQEERALRDRIAGAQAQGDSELASQLASELQQYLQIRSFDRPRRNYSAVHLTATKRLSRSFMVQGSYTYARTKGNYPGLYSPDNQQADPNITSQFDLIELLANRDGPLPYDRPHYVKLDGYYTFDFQRAGRLTTGVRFRALSGTPINALGLHYRYGVNESFLLPRGTMGRTGFDYGIDLRLTYARKIGKRVRMEVFTDLFNLLNRQGSYNVSQSYTLDAANPVVGGEYQDLIWLKQRDSLGDETALPVRRNANFLNITRRYAPFSARLGARLVF